MILLQVLMMITPEGGGALRRWIPAAFPPSDLLRRQSSVSLFLVSLVWRLSLRKTSGALYIGVFRSRGCFRAKDRCKRGQEGQMGWAHAARYCSRMGPPFGSSGLRSLTSFAPRSSSFQNNDPRKFQLIWTSFGSLKVKNMEKGFSGSVGLVPNKWGNCELSPKSI